VVVNMAVGATPRRAIASFERYEEAQEFVDRLADDGFPVEHLTIVGEDLQLVEQVLGRLNAWRAALAGAGSGAPIGLLFGLLYGVIFADDGVSLLGIVVYWLIVGAVVGGVFGLVSHLMTGGRRDFTSVVGVVAQRYQVLADEGYADAAMRRAAETGTSSTAGSDKHTTEQENRT
jgi:hypothetical protein